VKVTEQERLDNAEVALTGARNDLTIDIVAHWDESRRVLVRQRGETVFMCSATPRKQPLWLVTECVPQRRGPELASMLFAVCDRLAAERGASQILAISPASWDEHLAAGGARLLRRVVPMCMRLDEDLLLMHSRPLPRAHQIVPLEPPFEEPVTLARLSIETERESDLRVWRDVFCGDYGPVIPEATLQVVRGSTLCAAIATTEYHGAPLVAHFVTAATERGNGLGRALLVESLKRLSDSGYVDCHLNVMEDNWVAHRLYRSMGFIQVRPTLRVSHIAREPVR
jgi:GNAT superfamily N-acetyltransferase